MDNKHAKSTAVTLSFTLASILFRQKKFVLIVSDTESQAIMFLSQIKQELAENENIISLFGVKRDSVSGKVKFPKDSETDAIIEFEDGHRIRIIAKGSEQKLRGLLWDGKRPDLILCDDMENDEIVMNKERREKFRRWFYAALIPCMGKGGQIRYVGTILHMDAMLERLMPQFGQKGFREEGLKQWSDGRIGGWKSIKYRAHTDDFSEILWPAKWNKVSLKEERQRYVDQGMPDLYSQEYLNIPLDEANTFFKRNDFLPMTKENKESFKHFYVAADLAISEAERADWSVFVVGGIDQDNLLHIVHVIRERMDGYAIVQTILALQRSYNPELFGIEETQISKAIGPFLREEMIKQGVYSTIVPLKPHRADKLTRARSIQARMRAGGVRVDKDTEWYLDFENELMRFPRDRHDDQVDSFAYLGLLIDYYVTAPTKEEQAEDEYYEDLEESGLQHQGRSAICGY